MKQPVTVEHAVELGREFYARFPVSKMRLERALFELMDHGDIVPLHHAEVTALCDHLEKLAVRALMDNDPTVKPELKSAVCKLFFAHGRHYGMTNLDMGMVEHGR